MIAADQDRFEELEAGRILGDLDVAEWEEWKQLGASLERGPDLALELTAAALHTEMLQGGEETLPDGLTQKIKATIPEFVSEAETGAREPEPDNIVSLPEKGSFFSTPMAGWAVAAALAILLVVTQFNKPTTTVPDKAPTLAEAKASLQNSAQDLIVTQFQGLEGYDDAGGELIWSDEAQEGYMTLSKLPVNDQAKKQYQLWIVDPSRDDEPVDGGVFDIPTGDGPVVVKISNPVPVSKPKAFLITLEKAGGVVVSDQEVKVALAAL